MESYGYVETRGLVAAIEAVDIALKTADVRLTNCYYVKGGIVTVEVTGDVAAVIAAVDAASESARKLGNYLSSNVIAKVDMETKKILVNSMNSKEEKKLEDIQRKENSKQTVNSRKIKINEKSEINEISMETSEEERYSDTESEKMKKLKRKYQDMKVMDLKIKVNNLKLEYTWNQIKGMTKKKLIEILLKNN